MSAESLSPLHPCDHARGHAHPSPAITAITTDTRENQHLTDLLDQVSFNVEMHGFASKGTLPHEMYHPRLRKSDVTQQAISHLDTISCWKGISLCQAAELAFWESWFHHCLIEQIEDCLKRSIVTQLSKRKDHMDETTLLPCLIQSFLKDDPCLFHINLSCLFHDMIQLFYEVNDNWSTGIIPWSFDSGDVPRFVYNFLYVQDCFQNTPAGPCVFVNCSSDRFDFPFVDVTADVAWNPLVIEFRHVPAQIRPGAHYVIVPYREQIVEDPQQSEYKQYPSFTEYIVKKSTSKIQWDHRAALFRAQAPERVAIKDVPVSETIIQVTNITRFPDNVRFESTSRYVIKVNLIDTEELDTATDNNHSRNSLRLASCSFPRRRSYPLEPLVCQQGPTFSPVSLSELMAHPAPPLSTEQCQEEKFAKTPEIVEKMHNEYYTNPEVSGRSTKKRSNSLCKSETPSSERNRLSNAYSSGLDTELKRQKLDQTDVAGMKGVCFDRAMGTQCPTPPYTPITADSNDSDHPARLSSPVDMRASPSCHTRTGFKVLSQLSQRKIQRNYHEFEQTALRKLIDKPCVGDVSFERIFLGDSEAEDWHSSDLEGLNDEVNDIETEL